MGQSKNRQIEYLNSLSPEDRAGYGEILLDQQRDAKAETYFDKQNGIVGEVKKWEDTGEVF